MKIVMRANKVGVEKLGKPSKKNTGFIIPESVESLGIIKYRGSDVPDDLDVGTKVFYGDNRTQVRMGDADIEVMEPDNIYAIVEDTSSEKTKEETE